MRVLLAMALACICAMCVADIEVVFDDSEVRPLPNVRVGSTHGATLGGVHLLVEANDDYDAEVLVARVIAELEKQHNISAREAFGALLLAAEARVGPDTPFLRDLSGPKWFAIDCAPDGIDLVAPVRVVPLQQHIRARVTLRKTHASSPLGAAFNGTHIEQTTTAGQPCFLGRHRLGDAVLEPVDELSGQPRRAPMLVPVWAYGRPRFASPLSHGARVAIPLHSVEGSIAFEGVGDDWQGLQSIVHAHQGRFEAFELDLKPGVTIARQVAADTADGLVVVSAVSNAPFSLLAPLLACERHGPAVLCTSNSTALVDVTLSASAPAIVHVVIEHYGPEGVLAPGELLEWSESDKQLAYRLPAISNFALRSRHQLFAVDGAPAMPEFVLVLHFHNRPVGAHCSRVMLPLCLAGLPLDSASTDESRLWMLPVSAMPQGAVCHNVELMVRSKDVCLRRDDRIPFHWSVRPNAGAVAVRVAEQLQWMHPCACP